MTSSILEDFAGSMAVGELCARTGCSVEALVEFCSGHGGLSTTTAHPERVRAPALAVETRTQAGRETLDRALVELLQGVTNGMGARDIAEETGASLLQIRSSITRLVAKKKVRFEGKTTARRYWARG